MTAEYGESNRLRVAVIEDNQDAREFMHLALTDSFDVSIYRSAEEALPLLLPGSADVMLIDLRLQELDGMQFMKTLRAANVSMPMIMVTASVVADVEQKALAEGFDAFVPKPIMDLQALVALIKRLGKKRPDVAVA